MRAVLALAFLALAKAAIIEVPKTVVSDDIFIDPTWTSNMFAKYGLAKPMIEDVLTWGKTIGVEDPMVLNRMRSFYEKPSLVFFQGPSGKVVSYYAHEGIDKPFAIPEMKSALYDLYGASDKLAINFQPEHMLGSYRSVLPGHFFEPINNVDLHRFINDLPITADHVTFKPKGISTDLWKKFDIENLPMIYKEPVALDISKKFLSEGVVPYSHVSPFTGFSDVSAATPFGFGRSAFIPSNSHLVSGMPFTGFSDMSAAGFGRSGFVPSTSHLVSNMPFARFSGHYATGAVPLAFGKSAIIPGSSNFVYGTPFTGFSDDSAAIPFGFRKSGFFPADSHLVSEMPLSGFRSGLGVAPAVKSAAYHLVKADMPYFTAAPTTFVDSASAGFPLFKSGLTTEAAGFTPVHTIVPGTHFVHPTSPIFTSATPFAKSAFPWVNSLGEEHVFAPAGAGVIPLVKSFGADALTHFGNVDAYKSAFSADPTMTFGANPATSYRSLIKAAPVANPLFVSPSVGLAGHAGFPFNRVAWKNY